VPTTIPYHDFLVNIIGKLPLYSVDGATTILNHCFNQLSGMLIIGPFILRNSLYWASPALKNLVLHKKLVHAAFKLSNSTVSYSAFSELRAKYKRLSKIDYQSYISNSEKMLLHNPSAFWKFKKELNQNTTIPGTLRLDNKAVDSLTDSANLFSKYFSSVFRTSQSSFSDFSKNNIYTYI